jgi:hypothetical protein
LDGRIAGRKDVGANPHRVFLLRPGEYIKIASGVGKNLLAKVNSQHLAKQNRYRKHDKKDASPENMGTYSPDDSYEYGTRSILANGICHANSA